MGPIPFTASKKGTLSVQVRLNPDCQLTAAAIESEVRAFLSRYYKELRIGRIQPSSCLASSVERIEVTSSSKNTTYQDTGSYPLAENELKIFTYKLHTDENDGVDAEPDDLPAQGPFSVTHLPHQRFDGQWELLVYEEPLAERLLRVFSRAIRKFHGRPTELVHNAWYHTALLHGVPGSGKTSLAQALAQQLSLCLSDIYPRTQLLEVQSSKIFSHMYGGTPKEIGNLFTTIHSLASDDEEEARLIVVLVDEIDKLVPCRKDVGKKNEPQDTIRATAEVLTGLDKLRKFNNIVWLFTTNLKEDLDPAFIDRCRLNEMINAPMANSVFEILRTGINDKIKHGEILLDALIYDQASDTIMTDTSEVLSQSDGDKLLRAERPEELPTLTWAARTWPSTAITAVSVLYRIAELAAGLSGRNLRGLVDVTLFECFADDAPDLRDALEALESVVRREAVQGARIGLDDATAAVGIRPSGTTDDSDIEFVTGLPIEQNEYSDDE